MTTISCFLTMKYQLSNTLSVCFEKNAAKLRIHARLENPGTKHIGKAAIRKSMSDEIPDKDKLKALGQ